MKVYSLTIPFARFYKSKGWSVTGVVESRVSIVLHWLNGIGFLHDHVSGQILYLFVEFVLVKTIPEKSVVDELARTI